MENMILVDIETGGFDLEEGIREVALLVIEKNNIVNELHLAEIEDPSLIHLGMGEGYGDISGDITKIECFRDIVERYNYPVVAHNVSFDRKFLVHYGWLDEEHQCYDSIRAIKYANPYLFSYALAYLTSFYELENSQSHTALGDVKVLFEVLTKVNPSTWIPLYKVKPKQLNNIVETVARIYGESTIFKDKTIVFTGASQFPRVLMKEIASKCGAKVTGSVSAKTDYLICGENPGSKLEKATSLEVEVKTDVWFLDAVSGEIDLSSGTIERTRLPLEGNVEIQTKPPYQKLEEFKGKMINIACLPIRIQGEVESILFEHMEIKGVNKGSSGYKVDIIIHSDDGDYVLLEKAKQLDIKAIPLSKFNSMILANDSLYSLS